MLGQVLAFATESGNQDLAAQARSSLSTLAASQGRWPDALEHRTASVSLRRALKDVEILPYDLTNLAEALIRLGRGADAGRCCRNWTRASPQVSGPTRRECGESACCARSLL